MKKGKIVKFSAAAMVALSAITPVAAFANEAETPDGFYTGSTYLPATDFAKLSKAEKRAFLLENLQANALVLVQNGKVYDLTDEKASTVPADELESKTVEQYTAETGNKLTPNGIETPETTLTVTSVSAITNTINKTGGKVEIAINGETKAADLAALKEAGYTVEFGFSSGVTIGEDGAVTVGEETTSFRYTVAVYDAEGEEVATAGPQTVKVEDFSKQVTEFTAFSAKKGEVALVGNKVAKEDTITLVATGKTKEMAADAESKSLLGGLVKITSSNEAIATVNETTGEVAFTGAVGKVTFTAKAGTITKTLELEVVKSAAEVDPTLSSVSVSSIKDATGAAYEFTVNVKDTFGEVVTGAEVKFGEVTGEAVEGKPGTYKVSGNLGNTESKATKVDVTANGVKIGEVTVTVVAPGEATTKTAVAAKAKLDVSTAAAEGADNTTISVVSKDANGYTTGTVAITGENVYVDGEKDGKYVVTSSNKSVVDFETGKLVAKGKGTATITVSQYDGNLLEKINTIEIEVVDTTPVLTAAKFKTVSTKVLTANETNVIALTDLVDLTGFKLTGTGDYSKVEFGINDNLEITASVSEGADYGQVGNVIVTGLGATVATVGEGADAKLTIKIPANTSETKAVEGTVTVTIVDVDGNIIANGKVNVQQAKATPAEGGETDAGEGSGTDEGGL